MGRKPPARDVELLRGNAPAECANLEPDDLACYIVKQESERVLAACRADRERANTVGPARKKIA